MTWITVLIQPMALHCVMLAALTWNAHAQTSEPITELPKVECRSPDIFNCYQCKTSTDAEDHFCGDPFNQSHAELAVVQCQHHCAKWVVRLDSGAMQTTRTCSSQMQINLRIFSVCMRESGSSDGHVCFCEGDLCNASTPLTVATWRWPHALLLLMTSALVVCCIGLS